MTQQKERNTRAAGGLTVLHVTEPAQLLNFCLKQDLQKMQLRWQTPEGRVASLGKNKPHILDFKSPLVSKESFHDT